MTDARVSRGILQVLVRVTPTARVSRGVVQALATATPTARVSRGVLQALTSTTIAGPITAHYVRTAGSSRPLLMKQADGSWWPVQPVSPH